MSLLNDLLLSSWALEAARSASFENRGNQDLAVNAAERARILASRCAAEGIKIVPSYAAQQTEFLNGIAGTDEDMGALGLIFLQRIGMYINAHTEELLGDQHARLVELAEPELDVVNQALMDGRLLYPPPPEFPSAPEAKAPGKVLARFGILGDPHVGLADESVTTALEEMTAAGVDFIVAIGDLTDDGKLEDFVKARELFEKASVPVIVTLGNHDMWSSPEDPKSGFDRFDEAFGLSPNAIYEHNGVRVIVVNSANPLRSPFLPFDMLSGEFKEDMPSQTVPGGTFSEETISWLKGIGPAGPTFILLHHPPHPYMGMPPLVFGLDKPSTHTLAETAARVDARAIFCGHTHRAWRTELDGRPVIETASASDWPFGYSIVEVTDQGWSFNLYPIAYDAGLDPMSHKDYLFRRYVTGPEDARAFAVTDQ